MIFVDSSVNCYHAIESGTKVGTIVSSVCEELLKSFGLVDNDDVHASKLEIQSLHAHLEQRIVERRLREDGGVGAAGCELQLHGGQRGARHQRDVGDDDVAESQCMQAHNQQCGAIHNCRDKRRQFTCHGRFLHN